MMRKFICDLLLFENYTDYELIKSFIFDRLQTHVYVCYQPFVIACGSLFLACRLLQIALPTHPPWYSVFDCSLEDLENISGQVMNLYKLRVREWREIDDHLEAVRLKLYEDA
jgi:hypothetical protein